MIAYSENKLTPWQEREWYSTLIKHIQSSGNDDTALLLAFSWLVRTAEADYQR